MAQLIDLCAFHFTCKHEMNEEQKRWRLEGEGTGNGKGNREDKKKSFKESCLGSIDA